MTPLRRIRPRLLLVAIVALGAVGLGAWLTVRQASLEQSPAAPSPADRVQRLVSRPDLQPAELRVTFTSAASSSGYLFVTPGNRSYGDTGPMIVDKRGRPVWIGTVPAGQNATSFSVQRLRGHPVLTWWQGPIDREGGYGKGTFVLLDDSYRRIAEVSAGNGYEADLHELVITPRNTALLLVYHESRRDLSRFGGARNGRLLDNLVQEVDIATGRVLFEWSMFEHVPPSESRQRPPAAGGLWDPYHLNSAAVDAAGDFIVSARHTWAVYKISGKTGAVVWRLGGKASDFEMGPGASFAWQHDARWRRNGTLSLFDNQAASDELAEADRSRGLVLRLDEAAGRASLVREFTHPAVLLASSQGNLQNLPGGGVLIGWGSQPHLSQYDRAGRLVFDARFAASNQSYRAFLSPWIGRPRDAPAVVARSEDGRTTVHVSWNGATEVASWRVLSAGPADAGHRSLVTVPRDGFETRITLRRAVRSVRVQALATDGRVIGASAVTSVAGVGP